MSILEIILIVQICMIISRFNRAGVPGAGKYVGGIIGLYFGGGLLYILLILLFSNGNPPLWLFILGAIVLYVLLFIIAACGLRAGNDAIYQADSIARAAHIEREREMKQDKATQDAKIQALQHQLDELKSDNQTEDPPLEQTPDEDSGHIVIFPD